VGHDDIDGAKKTSIEPDRPIGRAAASRLLQQQMGDRSPKVGKRSGAHGAMSQQSSDSGRGTQSLPQKLVQLVGHRDPNACREAWVRPRAPVQR